MGMRRRSLMNVVEKSTSTNITIENVKGSWGESSKTVSGYQVYESKGSYNVNNGYDLAKVTFSGYPSFTFLYGSYAESSYDYVLISHLDQGDAQNWTNSSYSGVLLSTSGQQSSSAPNLSYTFTNDGGEHFFYILYRKDSSVNSGNDRGYIAFRQSNYLEVDTQNILLSHRAQSTTLSITSDMDWSISNSSSWVTLDRLEGHGSCELQIACSLNEDNIERNASIIISSSNKTYSITISQDAYSIDLPEKINIRYGTPTIITLEAELGLEVDCNCDWLLCEVISGEVGDNLKITLLIDTNEPVETVISVRSGPIVASSTVKRSSLPRFGSIECVFYAPLKNGVYRDEVSGIDPVINSLATIIDYEDYTKISLTDSKFSPALFYQNLNLNINPEQGWTLVCWCQQNSYSGNGYSAMCACPELSECRTSSNAQLYNGECYIAGVRFYSSIASSFTQKAAVLSNNGITMTFYNDGVKSTQYPSWGISSLSVNTPSSVAVCEIHYNNTAYSINISDVMVFNGILTPEQLQTLQRL